MVITGYCNDTYKLYIVHNYLLFSSLIFSRTLLFSFKEKNFRNEKNLTYFLTIFFLLEINACADSICILKCACIEYDFVLKKIIFVVYFPLFFERRKFLIVFFLTC